MMKRYETGNGRVATNGLRRRGKASYLLSWGIQTLLFLLARRTIKEHAPRARQGSPLRNGGAAASLSGRTRCGSKYSPTSTPPTMASSLKCKKT
jgi:hypothetical protein